MLTGTRNSVAAFLATCGFALGAPASAQQLTADVYFGYLSVGTSYVVGEGHVLWLGEISGTATDMGAGTILDNAAMKCPASLDLDFATGVATASGYCTITLTDGDSFVIRWSCERSLAGGTGDGAFPFGRDDACEGPSEVISATGGLTGLTGGNTFQAQTVLSHPDGKGSGYATQQWTLVLP